MPQPPQLNESIKMSTQTPPPVNESLQTVSSRGMFAMGRDWQTPPEQMRLGQALPQPAVAGMRRGHGGPTAQQYDADRAIGPLRGSAVRRSRRHCCRHRNC